MELKQNEIVLYLEELDIPEEVRIRCREMLESRKYQELFDALRAVRKDFLEDVHESQRRLDNLDYLIHDMKKKK